MKVPISDMIIKLINESGANLHDINHFLKVHAFAKSIGEKEGLEERSLSILETAAIVHDIACPFCREKYGSTEGSLQEKEGAALTERFLEEFQLPRDFVDEVVWLVSHHHTYSNVERIEHRILLEADFLVNADEGQCSPEQIEAAQRSFFRTKTACRLLESMYLGG